MPAKAGIQEYQMVAKAVDPGFRRGDDFCENVKLAAHREKR
jgi:hypothetical protein